MSITFTAKYNMKHDLRIIDPAMTNSETYKAY